MTLQTQGQNNLGDHKKTDLNVVGATSSGSGSNFDKKKDEKEDGTSNSATKKGCCY